MALKIGADILWEPTACSMPWIYGGFWWLQMYKVWSLCLKKSSSSGPDWLKSKQFIKQKKTKPKSYGEEAWRNERFKKVSEASQWFTTGKKKLTWPTWGYYLDISAWVGTGLWDSEEPNATQQSGSFVSPFILVLHQNKSIISLRKE